MSPSHCRVCGYRGNDFRSTCDGRYICPSCGELAIDAPSQAADVGGKITATGIALAVAGAVTFLLSAAWLAFAVVAMPPPVIPPDLPAEQQGGYVVGYRGIQFGPPLFGFAISLVEVAGGLQMLRRRTWGLALTGAVAAILPCTCGFVFGLPIGLWAIFVLADPAVKRMFR